MVRDKKIVSIKKAKPKPNGVIKVLTKAELQRLRGVVIPLQQAQRELQRAQQAYNVAAIEYTEVYSEFGLDHSKQYNITQEGVVTLVNNGEVDTESDQKAGSPAKIAKD